MADFIPAWKSIKVNNLIAISAPSTVEVEGWSMGCSLHDANIVTCGDRNAFVDGICQVHSQVVIQVVSRSSWVVSLNWGEGYPDEEAMCYYLLVLVLLSTTIPPPGSTILAHYNDEMYPGDQKLWTDSRGRMQYRCFNTCPNASASVPWSVCSPLLRLCVKCGMYWLHGRCMELNQTI